MKDDEEKTNEYWAEKARIARLNIQYIDGYIAKAEDRLVKAKADLHRLNLLRWQHEQNAVVYECQITRSAV